MLFIIIAAVSYAVAILFGTVASRHLNTNLSAAVANIVAAIIPTIASISVISRKSLANERFGLLMAICCGLFVAIFAMALTKSYSLNKVGIVAPLIFGGAILLSTILSLIFLKEKTTGLQIIGMFILAVGLGVITYARATGR